MADKKNKVTHYVIDDLSLDVQRGELTRDGEVITLPKLSYDLLVALAKASPALLSQQTLMQAVWPERIIGDETLKQRVKLLRKSLTDDASAPRYIEAVRGRGYRLIPRVQCECVVRQPPSVLIDLSANDRFPNLSAAHLNRYWRKISSLGITLFLLSVLAFFISSFIYQPQILREPSSTTNSENLVNKIALDYYQRGRDYYHRYRQQDNKIAINFFNQAIAKAPDFSRAYAALSQAYSQEYFQFGGHQTDKQLAIDNAYLALSYDNQLADGYKSLGTAYYVAGWLAKSVNTLLRAVAISPSDKEILTNLAFIYSALGDLNNALKWHKQVVTLAPHYAVALLHTGLTLQRAKLPNLAKKWYLQALDLQPDYLLSHYHLIQLAIAQQDYAEALSLFESATKINAKHPLLLQSRGDIAYFQGDLINAQQYYQRAASFADSTDFSRAEVLSRLLANQSDSEEHQSTINDLLSELKRAHKQGNEQYEISLYLAEIYSYQQNHSQAIRYLTQAMQQGYRLGFEVLHSPLLENLRKQTHYQRLITQMNEPVDVKLDKVFLLP